MYLSVPIWLTTYLSIHRSVCVSVCLSVCPSAQLSFCFVCPSICPSIYLSICLFSIDTYVLYTYVFPCIYIHTHTHPYPRTALPHRSSWAHSATYITPIGFRLFTRGLTAFAHVHLRAHACSSWPEALFPTCGKLITKAVLYIYILNDNIKTGIVTT